MSDSNLLSHLESHPKMIGVLFTIITLVSQAGAAAANGGSIQGP
jgi:hypothetical protein